MIIRILLTIFVAVFLVGCGGGSGNNSSSSATQSPLSVAGTWNFTGTSSSSGTQFSASATIAQNGSNLSGSYNLPGGLCATSGSFTGTLNGNALTINLNENGQIVILTGTVSGSSASGSYSTPSGGCTNGDIGTWAGMESGTGTSSPIASISPMSLTFASQNTNTHSTAQAITLSDTGTAGLSITTISISGDFSESDNCGKSVAAGASCVIQVTFTPTAIGTRTGVLTIQDSSANSPHTVNLMGTGTASNAGTPTGTSTVTITGTSGGKTTQMPFSLTVH
jgi:hypothetical protein